MIHFHIFPRFMEFVLLFGTKRRETEIGPPRMRFRRLLNNLTERVHPCYAGFGNTPLLSDIGRVLNQAECAYGLRYVELNHRDVRKPWSVRQTAMYHKYKIDQGCSTWVIISASKGAELSLDRYIRSSQVLSALSPFEIHLILLDAALANWRPYIIYLTEQIMNQVRRHSRSSLISTFTHIRISLIKYLLHLSMKKIR